MYWLMAGSFLLIVVWFLYGYLSNFRMDEKCCSKYEMNEPKVVSGQGLRMVYLADLHGWRYGKDNEKLWMKIRAAEPEIICIGGDMTVKEGEGCESALSLCDRLLEIAPVYYAMGNHEIRMPRYEEYVTRLEQLGVCVLRNESDIYQKDSMEYHIYGLDLPLESYARWKKNVPPTGEQLQELLGKPEERDSVMTILLAHNPAFFPIYASWKPDLVLSGHFHGGIMILPGIGGVIGPDFKLFPKYDEGLFREKDSYMIVSRGLGTHHLPFRFFNPPEMVILQINPGEELTLERK